MQNSNQRHNFHFVDLENIGITAFLTRQFSPTETVFVFTNSKNALAALDKHYAKQLSGYPTGSNQADFYIIAKLMEVLTNEQENLRMCNMVLHTKDKALITAFKYQCKRYSCANEVQAPRSKAKSNKAIPYGKKAQEKKKLLSLVENHDGVVLESAVINEFKTGKPISSDLPKKLNIPEKQCQRIIQKLISSGVIKRNPNRKKIWVAA